MFNAVKNVKPAQNTGIFWAYQFVCVARESMFVSCWLAEGNGQLYQIKVSIYSGHVQMILRGVHTKGGRRQVDTLFLVATNP